MAVHHDERPTRSQRTSVVAVAPRDQTRGRNGGGTVGPLLAQLFDGAIPVRFVFWDGSALGPEDGPGTVVLRSARVLTRLIWSPDELGMARSFVTGDIDFDGRLFDLLERLHNAVGGTGRFGALGTGECPEGSGTPRCGSAPATSTRRRGSPHRMASFAESRRGGDQASLRRR